MRKAKQNKTKHFFFKKTAKRPWRTNKEIKNHRAKIWEEVEIQELGPVFQGY